MSLSPVEWQSRFLKEQDKPIQWDDKERQQQNAPDSWRSKWEHWAEAAAQIKADKDGNSKVLKDFAKKIPEAIKQIMQAKVEPLIAEAEKKRQESSRKSPHITKDAINRKLNEVTYGP
ncbi:Trypanosomal VSG domain containing protein, putative [Trypanosoma equiperdum]|uniref:Trypanosomal VSG domain containing protein, putative n=1 Tax=Trypanosoma equiperdum TaxID=5694 RepID=A0A1G4IH00_TRYEQ|nr:Trypanosomal VSG domain containing protein, putative [Trypanosoma equiperdum]